jgi:hypothetical protein
MDSCNYMWSASGLLKTETEDLRPELLVGLCDS